jgi:Cu-Zn family superoxide dismutase
MKWLISLMVAVVAMVVAAGVVTVSGAYAAPGAQHASALVRDVHGAEIGFARFTEDASGRVHINVHVKGISSGLHGIHLHAVGSCDATTIPPFTSAGGHFNPHGAEHGLENPNGAHAGDLPNMRVNPAGVGHLTTTTDHVTLSAGATSVFDANGTALVIHASADDQVSNPAGNSGARIACGVLEAD